MTQTNLDFSKVEVLRKHLLLSMDDMAQLFGVTRLSYSKWVNGAKPRGANADTVRNIIRKLLVVMKEHQWPNPVRNLERAERLQRLLDLLATY